MLELCKQFVFTLTIYIYFWIIYKKDIGEIDYSSDRRNGYHLPFFTWKQGSQHASVHTALTEGMLMTNDMNNVHRPRRNMFRAETKIPQIFFS